VHTKSSAAVSEQNAESRPPALCTPLPKARVGLADEALDVEAQAAEGHGVIAEGFGVGDGVVDFGVFEVEVLADFFREAEGVEIVFGGVGSVAAGVERTALFPGFGFGAVDF
jgi:hypothetical protein